MSGTEIELPVTMDANPPPEDRGPVEGVRTPRDDIMATIAARREEQIARDNAQAAIYDREATEAGLNYPEDEPEPQPEPVRREVSSPVRGDSAVPTPPVQVSPPQPQVRTLVVDGQHIAVTEDQAERLIRLGMLANTALHQYQQQPVDVPPPLPEQPVVDNEAIREAVRKIQYGGEDDAATALTELIHGVVARNVPRGPAIDPSAIVHQAVTAAQEQARVAQAQEIIRQEYPDLQSNPQLGFLANTNANIIRDHAIRTGVQKSWLDIYREASNAVYDAIGRPRPGSAPDQPSALQAAPGNVIRPDVLERKRAAPRATQAIDMRSPAPAAPRPRTGSELVEEMRKARGQASMR